MNRKILIAVIGGAVTAAAVLIALSATAGGGGESAATPATTSAPHTGVLAGIPQHGTVLGHPSAPSVYEFADLQCPFCGDVSRDVIPSVVREYVRTGRVKLDFRPLQFVGPDSDRGARAVLAAGKQNRAWNMLERLYAVQGVENTGWLTEELLRQVAGDVPGLDVGRMLKDMDGVTPQLQKSIDQSNQLRVRGTPSFFLLQQLGQPQELRLDALSPEGFRAALEPLLT